MGGSGKGGETQQYEPPPENNQNAENEAYRRAMEQQMAQMQMQMQASLSQVAAMAASTPATPQVPTVFKETEVDWTDKQDELNKKMKAEYATDRARRKGRLDTVHTSSLMDDSDPSLTTSILAS